jgi:hypothetical protein
MRPERYAVDPGPITLVYYSMCAAPGAAAGLIRALSSGFGAGAKLITTIAGAIGGIGGGMLLATLPTQPPGRGDDALVVATLILFTALCGLLLSFVATRLLRRSGG